MGAFGAPFDFTIGPDYRQLVDVLRSYMENGREVKIYYTSYGPAVCATGSGHFPDMWVAARAMARVATRLEPDPAAHALYERRYVEIFTQLYPRVKDLFPRLR